MIDRPLMVLQTFVSLHRFKTIEIFFLKPCEDCLLGLVVRTKRALGAPVLCGALLPLYFLHTFAGNVWSAVDVAVCELRRLLLVKLRWQS